MAARVFKTAASTICWEVPLVDHPPHWQPMVIAMTAPRIRPQTPYLTLSAVSGFIDNASLKCGGIPSVRYLTNSSGGVARPSEMELHKSDLGCMDSRPRTGC